MRSELDEILGQAVASGALSGVAAAVTTPDQTHVAAAGERSAGCPMTPETVVWIASMTKAVTAVAAMQLVEQGRLELDAPCGDLVPYLAAVQVLEGFAEDGQPILRPPKRAVTLRHLLTHTAGFGYEFTNRVAARYTAGRGESVDGSIASYEQPLLFDPGERWEYGINVDWAGQVIEAATKTRLDDHLRSCILEPLGMGDTDFRRDEQRRARTADMHLRTPEGLVQIPFELNEEPEMVMAGGGLYGTVVDYLRFLQMLLGGGSLEGTRIVRPETVRMMGANQIGDLTVAGWKTVNPAMSNDVALGVGQQFGLGFLVNPERSAEGRAPGSMMWAGLANTFYWVDPTSQVAGVFATQVLPFFDGPAVATSLALERAVYASL
jgi:CubicO group peptidase (beta-lactamase class C family)